MSLEKLLQTINDRNDYSIAQIELETKTEIDNIIKNFDDEMEVYSNTEFAKAKNNIKLLEQKEYINLDIYKRKSLLEVKRTILDSVYLEFINKLKNLDMESYKFWLLKKLDNFDFLHKKGELFIGIGNFSEKFNENFSKDIIVFLNSKNLTAIKVNFISDIDFGFKYSEGSIIIDFSLEAIISEIKQNSELKIANSLFS